MNTSVSLCLAVCGESARPLVDGGEVNDWV